MRWSARSHSGPHWADTEPTGVWNANMVCTAEGAIDAWSTAYNDAVDKRPDALVDGYGPEHDHVATTATTPGEVGHALIADPANDLADGETKKASAVVFRKQADDFMRGTDALSVPETLTETYTIDEGKIRLLGVRYTDENWISDPVDHPQPRDGLHGSAWVDVNHQIQSQIQSHLGLLPDADRLPSGRVARRKSRVRS